MDYAKWVKNGKLLDITDVVTTSGGRDGNKTIESKLTDDHKAFFGDGGKYYALPHHDHQAGMVYDVDLFEQEELYFAKNGAPSEKNYGGKNRFTSDGERSAGPDGEYGTDDDGLPATYEDFYILCDYMVNKTSDIDIKPILWSGKNKQDYLDWFLSELTADFEGAEQLRINYTYSGTAKNLVSVSADGTVTRLPAEAITDATGYKIYQSEGRYRALQFLDKIVDTKSWYNEKVNFGSLEHTETQYEYLKGGAGLADVRYAFLVEGCWWENEAGDSFAKIVDQKGEKYAKGARNFAFMPLPKATADKIGDPFTLATTDVTVGFVKSNIEASKINLAKTFMRFVYEDEQLKMFNMVSGLPASVNYTLSAEEIGRLDNFSRTIYNVKNNVVSPYSSNQLYMNNFEALKLSSTFSAGAKRAVEALRETDAATYFNLLVSAKSENAWKESYKYYFND